MGIFQRKQEPRKKAPIDETSDGVQRFFDGYFSELKDRGRAHFEETVNESAESFKKDLDTSVAKVSTELHNYIVQRVDEQIVENGRAMKDAQAAALQSFTLSVKTMQEQHQQLLVALQKSVADMQQTVISEDAVVTKGLQENHARVGAMKDAQEAALQQLNESVKILQQESEQIGATLQKNVASQETMLVDAFQDNMASIIEHYLLGSLGDQYDMKAQLPSIIKQMEANKESIVEDMKL